MPHSSRPGLWLTAMIAVMQRERRLRHCGAAIAVAVLSMFFAGAELHSADNRVCAGAAPIQEPNALGMSCLLAENPSLRAALAADPVQTARVIQEIQQRYQALPEEAFDERLRPRGPLPEGLSGAPVLAPIYRTDPEAALDL